MKRLFFFTTDIMFPSRVSHVAGQCGGKMIAGSRLESLTEALAAEPLAMVIVDLGSPADLPAIAQVVRSAPQSEPAKLIAFGPHVAEAKLAAAREAGFDEVMPRGRFHAQLENIVRAALA